MKQVWAQEYRDWNEERLDKDRRVYVWADGVYNGLRAEQAKLCAWLVIGVNEHSEKRFLAIEDGLRESTQSCREVLLKLKSLGMDVPKLAIGDVAMGFWAALEEVYLDARQQRCLTHKTMNVLNCLPHPDLIDLVTGRLRVEDIREVGIGDLLGRETVPPEQALLEASVTGKSVMVTGGRFFSILTKINHLCIITPKQHYIVTVAVGRSLTPVVTLQQKLRRRLRKCVLMLSVARRQTVCQPPCNGCVQYR